MDPLRPLRLSVGSSLRAFGRTVLRYSQQFRGVFSQYGALIALTEARNTEHGIDFARIAHEGIGHVERKIRAEQYVARTHFGDQMAQAFRGEHNRVAI